MRAAGCGFVAMMGGAAFTDLQAQAVARVNRATLQLPVTLSIAARLTVSQSGPAQVVGGGPGYTELELPLGVAANLPWSLGLSFPDAAALDAILAVRDASGAWVTPREAERVPLVRRREPTNPTEVRVRIRVVEGSALASVERIRLHLDPAEGAEAP